MGITNSRQKTQAILDRVVFEKEHLDEKIQDFPFLTAIRYRISNDATIWIRSIFGELDERQHDNISRVFAARDKQMKNFCEYFIINQKISNNLDVYTQTFPYDLLTDQIKQHIFLPDLDANNIRSIAYTKKIYELCLPIGLEIVAVVLANAIENQTYANLHPKLLKFSSLVVWSIIASLILSCKDIEILQDEGMLEGVNMNLNWHQMLAYLGDEGMHADIAGAIYGVGNNLPGGGE